MSLDSHLLEATSKLVASERTNETLTARMLSSPLLQYQYFIRGYVVNITIQAVWI
jgi:hypothetical protein